MWIGGHGIGRGNPLTVFASKGMRDRHKKTTMTSLLQTKTANRKSTQAGPREAMATLERSSLSGPSVPNELTDCHAAEHLLVGTHNVGASGTMPACLTCRFQGLAA